MKRAEIFLVWSAVSVVIGLLATALVVDSGSERDYRRACESAGHHIVDRNGHWLCVSADGRVVEP